MKLLALFLAGFVTGACFSWLYLRATLRTYEKYIHDRIDKPLKRAQNAERVARLTSD